MHYDSYSVTGGAGRGTGRKRAGTGGMGLGSWTGVAQAGTGGMGLGSWAGVARPRSRDPDCEV